MKNKQMQNKTKEELIKELKGKNFQYGFLSNKYAELKEVYNIALEENNRLRGKSTPKEIAYFDGNDRLVKTTRNDLVSTNSELDFLRYIHEELYKQKPKIDNSILRSQVWERITKLKNINQNKCENDSQQEIDSNDSVAFINPADTLPEQDEVCECGHDKAFHEIDDRGYCIYGLRLSDSGMQTGKCCKCKKYKVQDDNELNKLGGKNERI